MRQPAKKRLMVHGHQKLPPATGRERVEQTQQVRFSQADPVSAGQGPPTTPTKGHGR